MGSGKFGENELLGELLGSAEPLDVAMFSLTPMTYLSEAADTWVYFPVDALVAVQLGTGDHPFQVGLIGSRGAIGLHGLFAAEFPRLEALVLKGGQAFGVRRAELFDLFHRDRAVRDILTRHVVSTAGDFLAEAAMAATLTLERRVARWIISLCHQLERGDIRFTHQQVAKALGVRRSGVTVALHVLEGERLIRSDRARILLRDQRRLEDYAGLQESPDLIASPAILGEPASRAGLWPS